jgi:uncharacterized protein (TIGR02996 family)
MPIWFVYRSPKKGPLSKHVRRLDGADTLLDWFRSVWRPIPGDSEAWEYAEELLGTHVNWAGTIFKQIAEENVSPPATIEELARFLVEVLEGGSERFTPDTIQFLSGYDDDATALYWFTDRFAQAHPERVAYLLHEDWRLPEKIGPGAFKPKPGVRLVAPRSRSKKGLYCVELYWDNSGCDLEDLAGAEKLPGKRLEDLVSWALGLEEDDGESLDYSPLFRVREPLLRLLQEGEGLEGGFRRTLADQPGDAATWAAYTDWLAENDRPRAELHLLELALCELQGADYSSDSEPRRVQVSPHCAAVMLPQGDGEFYQWFFFDDVWASGNVDLANALLDYALRYNVLDAWDVSSGCGGWIPPGKERCPEE